MSELIPYILANFGELEILLLAHGVGQLDQTSSDFFMEIWGVEIDILFLKFLNFWNLRKKCLA